MLCRVNFQNIQNISLVEQQFGVKAFIECSWTEYGFDPTCLADGSSYEVGCETDERKGKLVIEEDEEHFYFTPRINMRNMLEEREQREEWFTIYTCKNRKKIYPYVVCYRFNIR